MHGRYVICARFMHAEPPRHAWLSPEQTLGTGNTCTHIATNLPLFLFSYEKLKPQTIKRCLSGEQCNESGYQVDMVTVCVEYTEDGECCSMYRRNDNVPWTCTDVVSMHGLRHASHAATNPACEFGHW